MGRSHRAAFVGTSAEWRTLRFNLRLPGGAMWLSGAQAFLVDRDGGCGSLLRSWILVELRASFKEAACVRSEDLEF